MHHRERPGLLEVLGQDGPELALDQRSGDSGDLGVGHGDGQLGAGGSLEDDLLALGRLERTGGGGRGRRQRWHERECQRQPA